MEVSSGINMCLQLRFSLQLIMTLILIPSLHRTTTNHWLRISGSLYIIFFRISPTISPYPLLRLGSFQLSSSDRLPRDEYNETNGLMNVFTIILW